MLVTNLYVDRVGKVGKVRSPKGAAEVGSEPNLRSFKNFVSFSLALYAYLIRFQNSFTALPLGNLPLSVSVSF